MTDFISLTPSLKCRLDSDLWESIEYKYVDREAIPNKYNMYPIITFNILSVYCIPIKSYCRQGSIFPHNVYPIK